MLEMISKADRISWLTARFGSEEPFVEYHAAAALLTAVRDLGQEHHPELEEALKQALGSLKERHSLDTDRGRLVRWALSELDADRWTEHPGPTSDP